MSPQVKYVRTRILTLTTYESILLNWSRIARNQKSTVLLKFAEVGEVAEHDQSPRGQGILKLQAW